MNVLIVDDDKYVVDYLTNACKSHAKADVRTAYSAEEALGCVIQERFDLITLDLRMPGVNGLEILAPLRNMCPHAVIAVISGNLPDAPDPQLDGCADVVLAKPVHLTVLHCLLDGATRIRETMEGIRSLANSVGARA